MKFKGKWLPESENFKKVCLEMSKELSGFKRNPEFIKYIGNDIRKVDVAKAFYEYIQDKYMYLLQYNYITNDIIGDPNTFIFDNKEFSPGTLRFVKVIGDIYEHFGNVKKIVEIGSGYGGQALVFNLVQNVDYTCIDIPECIELARNYHNTLGWKSCRYMTTENIKESEYDLCISDYCLGELDKNGIRFYIDNILSNCNFVYITMNKDSEVYTYLMGILIDVFDRVECVGEEPKTTKHNNCIIYCKNDE